MDLPRTIQCGAVCGCIEDEKCALDCCCGSSSSSSFPSHRACILLGGNERNLAFGLTFLHSYALCINRENNELNERWMSTYDLGVHKRQLLTQS